MRDYAQVLTKIRETPWLITEQGLQTILTIVNDRISNGRLSDEEIQARLELPGSQGSSLNINGSTNGKNIGVIPLAGPLFGRANLLTEMSGATSLEMFRNDFRTMMADPNVHAIILDVDSPGGTSELVQEVGDEIFAARGEKPIYALANGTAGSAAYWLASQAEHFSVTPSGMVGSIGAYTVHEDQSGMDEQQGKQYTFISAGEFKTEGNPHEPLSEEGRAYRQEIIDGLYADFVSAVSQGRNVTAEKVKSDFGGGRMLTSKAALASGMVDGISTMEGLVAQIGNRPTMVTISNNHGDAFAMGQLTGNSVQLTSPLTIAHLESKEYEHSEPGTGSPPAPRTDQSGSDDISITQKWRRDQLPVDPSDPVAPKTNPPAPNTNLTSWREGNTLSEENTRTADEIVAELRGGLNLGTDVDLVDYIKDMHDERMALEASVASVNEEDDFSKKYPALWAEHQELLNDRSNNRAAEFAKSVATIGFVEGEGIKPSKFGLSALAMEEIAGCHIKFASGRASLSDFENAIKVITQGGIVQYGEVGTSVAPNLPTAFSTTTAEGIVGIRKEFAMKVSEIQKKDNLTYTAALTEAAKQYPELAAAYQSAVPVNTH